MLCHIAPPHLLSHLIEQGTPEQSRAARLALASSATQRAQRRLVGRLMRELGLDSVQALGFLTDTPGGKLSVYDVQHGGNEDLPGKLVRGPDDGPVSDDAVNEAYDGAGTTHDFYLQVYERDSVDGEGAELVSSVHYGVDYDNAFWNGVQMVYGDGSGQLFQVGALTKALDVIGHELTHGVTQYTAGLDYSKQPGALNEHFSDVFGSLVKQWAAGESAEEADWLIGEGTLVPSIGKALRSMKAPGTAWDGDNQPSDMSGYVDLPDDNDPANDNGGVHINSGIPNHAFYLAATAIGGNAWEKAGRVWYVTLTERTAADAQFTDVASATVDVAGELLSAAEQSAISDAWTQVGVL
jgi:Zn-dependent metalloprotease